MTARGERPGEPVPDDVDQPSSSVLDELLRVFNVDPADADRLAAIDLTSPEVAELLGPSPRQAEPLPDPEIEPHVEVEVDHDRQPVDHPDDATDAGDRTPDPPAPPIDPLLNPPVEVEEVTPSRRPAADGKGSTFVISDDSLPDPVYVEGSLEPGPVTTVFIDDDATGEDTYGASGATSTRIEPRFRQRRIAVRRSAGRRRLRWVAIATAVLVVVVAGLAVLGSSWFAISAVEVEGVTYSDQAAVDAVVEDLMGTPVLRADTDAAEQQLEAIAWVEDAVVTTDFPHGATIQIRERTPVAAFRGADGRYRVIDRSARVLDVLGGEPIEYLLVATEEPPDTAAGGFAPQGFAAAAALVDALTPTMRSRAQALSVTPDGGDLRMQLEGGTDVRFGRGEDLISKLVRLETVLDDESVVRPSVIDVSTSEVTIR